MVRIHPDPPGQKTDDRRRKTEKARRVESLARARSVFCPASAENGAVAQLGEHLLCKQGVVGSIPISSTKRRTQKPEVSKAEARGKRRAFTSDLWIGTEARSVVL